MRNEHKIFTPVIIILIVFIPIIIFIFTICSRKQEFNSQRALDDVKFQVDLGPRTMGSTAHDLVSQWIISDLLNANWKVDTQETVTSGMAIKNIIAQRGSGTPWIIIASHYDSRLIADNDPNLQNRKLPVVGANDGASSAAVLLELGRVLSNKLNKQIWLVFFDAEDNGSAFGSGWDLGSQYFVSKLDGKPDSVVILDMIGDKDLDIYMERNSNPDINKEIWGVAFELGYSQFIPTYKYSLIDDHTPFIQAGIRAVDVIDFDYPYWHTVDDTLDKVSADSLKVVGETILKWLEQYPK
jgi:Zn-dependent M28 family amino/carboxypeptidase